MYKLKEFTVYNKKTPIINNVNCDIIVEKDINIIFGDNAVGKTTLLNILNFNNFDYQGEVYYLGNNIKEFSRNEINKIRNTEFGILNQDLQLFDKLSVMDNLKIAANVIYEEEHYISLLKQVNIRPDIHHEKVKKLSIGQKQRLAIARCILNDNKVLFFDEPTASLDAKNIEDFLILIDSLKAKGITIIIITHDKMFLNIYNNFVEVENTKIIPSYFAESNNQTLELDKFKRPKKSKKIINKLSGKIPLLTTLLLSAFIVCFTIYVSSFSLGIINPKNNLESELPSEAVIVDYINFETIDEYKELTNLFKESEVIKSVDTYTRNPGGSHYNAEENDYYFTPLYASKSVFEDYNYLNINMRYGEYPNDDTNEILIDYDYATVLMNQGMANSYDELVGKTITFPSMGGFSEYDSFVISGIYLEEHGNSNYQLYLPYDSVENKLMSEEEHKKSGDASTYLEYLNHYFYNHSLYITTNSAESATKLKEQIKAVSPSVETDNKKRKQESNAEDIFYSLFIISILMLCYAVVVFIISILGRLILIKSHKKLKTIGYTKKEIVNSNIKQNFKYVTIMILVILLPIILLTSFNTILIIILIILLIVSYISILLANLIMNRFIK